MSLVQVLAQAGDFGGGGLQPLLQLPVHLDHHLGLVEDRAHQGAQFGHVARAFQLAREVLQRLAVLGRAGIGGDQIFQHAGHRILDALAHGAQLGLVLAGAEEAFMQVGAHLVGKFLPGPQNAVDGLGQVGVAVGDEGVPDDEVVGMRGHPVAVHHAQRGPGAMGGDVVGVGELDAHVRCPPP
ncbi:MAG: hypothetical protein NVV74_24815 [Magnetospirillum sp.]|nr:hypothetical protein [Magnetospirillum sp.]